MSKTSLILGGAAVVAFAVTSHVLSQSSSTSDPWQKYSVRSANHDLLDWFVGDWTHHITFWPSPGAAPEEVIESCRYEWTMGGRFLVGEYTGDRGRDVFRGREVIGYDSFRQEYRWFWVNNMTTGFTLATGHADKKTRTLTMEGVQDDIEQGLRDQPFKVVYKYVNDNEMSIEVYKTVGGKLYKRAKVRSVRNNE